MSNTKCNPKYKPFIELQSLAKDRPAPKNNNASIADMVKHWVEALKESHGGNPFPLPNMREVDQQGLYASNFCLYKPFAEGYGYVSGNFRILGRDTNMCQGHWYVWSDGTGLFIYRGWGKLGGAMIGGVSQSSCEIRFFMFGCNHEWQQTRNLGNCYNEYTCKHCGAVQNIDSSD